MGGGGDEEDCTLGYAWGLGGRSLVVEVGVVYSSGCSAPSRRRPVLWPFVVVLPPPRKSAATPFGPSNTQGGFSSDKLSSFPPLEFGQPCHSLYHIREPAVLKTCLGHDISQLQCHFAQFADRYLACYGGFLSCDGEWSTAKLSTQESKQHRLSFFFESL